MRSGIPSGSPSWSFSKGWSATRRIPAPPPPRRSRSSTGGPDPAPAAAKPRPA